MIILSRLDVVIIEQFELEMMIVIIQKLCTYTLASRKFVANSIYVQMHTAHMRAAQRSVEIEIECTY